MATLDLVLTEVLAYIGYVLLVEFLLDSLTFLAGFTYRLSRS